MNTLEHNRDHAPSGPSIDLQVWADPNDVLSDPVLTVAEKRALLASWASDARAVFNCPAVRQLESGALVLIDTVLDALKQLDKLEGPARLDFTRERPRRGHWSMLSRRWRKHRKDDDDPFSPAPAMRPPRPPSPDGATAAAAS